MANFADRLAEAVTARKTPGVVGLDPRWESLPACLQTGNANDLVTRAESYETFCREVIDVVAPLVPAVKPQMAFFEELGPAGMWALSVVVRYAHSRGLLVILDGKRGDIGSTATAYAAGLLGRDRSAWGGDALTVNPYLGDDSLQPFVEVAVEHDAGLFVLVKTSNPGGKMFQDLQVDRSTLFEHVGQYVETLADQTVGKCGYGAVGAVVGATYPAQLASLREAMPHTWFLVPGFGSQGGTAADVAPAFDKNGLGAIVNSSRAIIFAHRRPEFAERFGGTRWQQAVEAATREMNEQLPSLC